MNAARVKAPVWLVTSATALVAGGCWPSGGESVDTLPWGHPSVSPVVIDAPERVETAFRADAPAQLSAEEIAVRDRVVQAHIDELKRIAAHPLLVLAVQKANDFGWQTQDQIEQTDQRWRQTKGVDDPWIKSYLENPAADFLRNAQQANPNFIEMFVMDNKGCIVAESGRTSDFWQGDEPKWLGCFNNGNGRVYVGDVEYDRSTRLYVIQLSLPIYDEYNATIGVMTSSVSSNKYD